MELAPHTHIFILSLFGGSCSKEQFLDRFTTDRDREYFSYQLMAINTMPSGFVEDAANRISCARIFGGFEFVPDDFSADVTVESDSIKCTIECQRYEGEEPFTLPLHFIRYTEHN